MCRAGLKTTALHHGMSYSRLSVSPILAQSCPVEKGGSTACALWSPNGAFPLHGTVRFSSARLSMAQFGSVCVSTAV